MEDAGAQAPGSLWPGCHRRGAPRDPHSLIPLPVRRQPARKRLCGNAGDGREEKGALVVGGPVHRAIKMVGLGRMPIQAEHGHSVPREPGRGVCLTQGGRAPGERRPSVRAALGPRQVPRRHLP